MTQSQWLTIHAAYASIKSLVPMELERFQGRLKVEFYLGDSFEVVEWTVFEQTIWARLGSKQSGRVSKGVLFISGRLFLGRSEIKL